ncbi:MAG: hypothetical protein ACI84D_003273, partial [Thalassolituus oleivorans]
RHDRVLNSLRRHRVYRWIKKSHLARMDRDWEGLIPAKGGLASEDHPFAQDLDILGPRSLHHLIDTSFSDGGSHRLAEWLTQEVPDPEASVWRQGLVKELVSLTPLRDRISLLSMDVGGAPPLGERSVGGKAAGEPFEGEVLLAWLKRQEDDARIRPMLLALFGLAALTALLVVLNLAGMMGPWWILNLVIYASVYLLNGKLYSHLFDEAEHLHYQMERFRPVVERLEGFRFKKGSQLAQHLLPFQAPGARPSTVLRRVMWLAMAASAQKSELLRVALNLVIPWDLLCAYRLSRLKDELRSRLPVWLDRVYTLEAAGSLATYAVLNPDACFSGAPAPDVVFDARELGHPLIPREAVIRNDYRVDACGHVALITGSNMSGKSTFLRAVGISHVMASAGGPVDARSHASIPFRLFSSMGIHDSVNDGISFFYAEVRRLGRMNRQVTGSSEPSMVLIDEIFRGTNNRERLIGSRALLQSLVKTRSVGLVATHDLELVSLSDESAGFRNWHFREEVTGGRMVFDYLLHPGPCPTTNALKIMAAEGLPVPGDSVS